MPPQYGSRNWRRKDKATDRPNIYSAIILLACAADECCWTHGERILRRAIWHQLNRMGNPSLSTKGFRFVEEPRARRPRREGFWRTLLEYIRN